MLVIISLLLFTSSMLTQIRLGLWKISLENLSLTWQALIPD